MCIRDRIKQLIGVAQVRVRDFDGAAKIEVEPHNISLFYENDNLDQVIKKLQMIGFSSVSVDPDGYMSGKLNLVYEK